MKKIFLAIAMALTFVACGTSQTAQQRQASQREKAAQVSDSLSNRTFTVEFNYMHPQRFQSRSLTSIYFVKVMGDSVYSYLPYIGVAYRADYNGDNPLDFHGHIESYETEPVKNDGTLITFDTRNKLEKLTYRLTVYSNGSAYLDVQSVDRESISYTGEMNLEPPRN
jgi:opacity protein-like surface antigen